MAQDFDIAARHTNGDTTHLVPMASFVWDTGTLAWAKETQPTVDGGAAAVSIADGADVAQGTTTDAEAEGNGTVIAILKRIRTLLGGTIAVSGTFWQATQPVSGTVTANTGLTQPLTDAELRAAVVPVDGSGVTQPVSGTFWQATQPVSGTVTANAGTNLNTSALALEAGGNLAAQTTALQIIDDWDESDRAKVNPIAGQAGVQGASGTVSANTQRVVLATDVALPAGTNNIGDVDVVTLPTSGGKTITYVSVAQGAAGTTQLAAASGAAKHKVVGCILTMSAAGTLKFVDSSGDLTGAMDVAASGGFVLPTSMLPYFETGAVNRTISITTTTGAAKGVVAILTEA